MQREEGCTAFIYLGPRTLFRPPLRRSLFSCRKLSSASQQQDNSAAQTLQYFLCDDTRPLGCVYRGTQRLGGKRFLSTSLGGACGGSGDVEPAQPWRWVVLEVGRLCGGSFLVGRDSDEQPQVARRPRPLTAPAAEIRLSGSGGPRRYPREGGACVSEWGLGERASLPACLPGQGSSKSLSAEGKVHGGAGFALPLGCIRPACSRPCIGPGAAQRKRARRGASAALPQAPPPKQVTEALFLRRFGGAAGFRSSPLRRPVGDK